MPRAIKRQAEQYPDRIEAHYADYGPEENAWEHQREHEPGPQAPSFSFKDPRGEHAYHVAPHFEPDQAEGWERTQGGKWEPPAHVERALDDAEDKIHVDEQSGLNWGPPPEERER